MKNFYADVCFHEHFLWFSCKYNLITSAVVSAHSFLGLLEHVFQKLSHEVMFFDRQSASTLFIRCINDDRDRR